jgi:peptidoglycan/LPS O-acetylase OafA/YrhL
MESGEMADHADGVTGTIAPLETAPRPSAIALPEPKTATLASTGDQTNSARGRLSGLDGLRAVAVVLVLFAHYGYTQHAGSLFDRLVEHGGFGVEMFFVLSGFLITFLLLREESSHGAISLRRFYARRAIRILPPLFFYLAVLLVATLLGYLFVPIEDLLAGVLFVRNYFGTSGETQHLWSLGIEEQFYLAWPALVVLLGQRWRVVFAVAAVALLPVWMNLSYVMAGGGENVNNWRTDLRLLPLMVGVLLALVLSSQAGRKSLTAPLITSSWVACAALVLVCLSVFTATFDIRIVRAFSPLISCFGVALIINYCVNRGDSWPTRLLEISVVAWLGRLSYSLYIWQQLFAPVVEPTTWYRAFPINLVGAFVCAMFSYYIVEQPLLRLRERLR